MDVAATYEDCTLLATILGRFVKKPGTYKSLSLLAGLMLLKLVLRGNEELALIFIFQSPLT